MAKIVNKNSGTSSIVMAHTSVIVGVFMDDKSLSCWERIVNTTVSNLHLCSKRSPLMIYNHVGSKTDGISKKIIKISIWHLHLVKFSIWRFLEMSL